MFGNLTRMALFMVSPLCLSAACGAGDGWPRDRGGPWRMVVDGRDGAPVVMLNRGEQPDDALIIGYREMARSPLRPPDGPWAECPDPNGVRGYNPVLIQGPPKDGGLAWVGQASAPEMPPPPVNSAAVVMKAQGRLKDRMGELGVKEADMFSLRSLLKTRRHGAPPVLLAVGDAGCTGMVAVLDRDADQVLAHDIVEIPGPPCLPLAAMPPLDVDGDGHKEVLLRSGRGRPNSPVMRAVMRLETDQHGASLHRVWRDTLEVLCPTLQ